MPKYPGLSGTSGSKSTALAKKDEGWWGTVTGAVGRFFKGAYDTVQDFWHNYQPIGSDIFKGLQSLAPGGQTPSEFYDNSRLVKPVFEAAKHAVQPWSKSLVTAVKDPSLGNIAKTFTWYPQLLDADAWKTGGKVDLGKGVRTLAEGPAGFALPGVNSLSMATTKAGRQLLAEHPGWLLMDIQPLLPRITPLIGAISRTMSTVAGKTKIGTRIGAALTPTAAYFGTKGAKTAQPVWTIERQVLMSDVIDNAIDIASKAPKTRFRQLDLAAEKELTERLGFGNRPPAGHPLREMYDEFEAHQAVREIDKTLAALPEPFRIVAKTKALMTKKAGANAIEVDRAANGVSKELNIPIDEAIERVGVMVQAIYDDAPNPFAFEHPYLNQTFKKLEAHAKGGLTRNQANYHMIREPYSQGLYDVATWRKFRKELYRHGDVKGKPADLGAEAARWTAEGRRAPDPGETAGRRMEIEEALKERSPAQPLKPGDFHIVHEGEGVYWAKSKRPDQPHLGPFKTASEAVKAIRSELRKTPDAPEGLLDELADLDQVERIARYIQTVKNVPPQVFRKIMEPMQTKAWDELERAYGLTGLDEKVAKQAAEHYFASARETLSNAVEAGVRPVFFHTKALRSAEETVTDVTRRAGVPSSSKPGGGRPEARFEHAVWGMLTDDAEWLLRDIRLREVSNIWIRDGKRTYYGEMAKLLDKGFDEGQAHALIKKTHQGIDIDLSGIPKFSEAGKGKMLVTKATYMGLKAYFQPHVQNAVMRKGLNMWMFFTLGLAPAFLENNAVGGAIAASLRLAPGNPIRMTRDALVAFGKARKGELLDYRIPSSVGFKEIMGKVGAANAEEFAKRNSFYGEGLAKVFRIVRPGRIVEFTDYVNRFTDQFFKNFVALSHSPKYHKTGQLTDRAVLEASRMMQNIENMSPFERNVMQRLIPFWSWKKALITHVMTYPADHPVRNTILVQMARQHEEDRIWSEYIDNLLADYLPIGEKDADGYQKMMAIRRLNPYADFADMATLKGWLNSLHPGLQAIMRVFNYDPFVGGTRAFTRTEDIAEDPDTGAKIKKLQYDAILEIIPQMRALREMTSLPEPDEDTPEGWFRWWKDYGASLRLLPSLRYMNLEEEGAKNLKPGDKPYKPTGFSGSGATVNPQPYRGGAKTIQGVDTARASQGGDMSVSMVSPPPKGGKAWNGGHLTRTGEGQILFYPRDWEYTGVFQWWDPAQFPGAKGPAHWVHLDPNESYGSAGLHSDELVETHGSIARDQILADFLNFLGKSGQATLGLGGLSGQAPLFRRIVR